MNSLDLLVLAILVGSAALGLLRGLTREVFSLAAWILAFLGARLLGPLVSPLMPGADNPALQYAAAMALVFVAVLIGASLLGGLLAGLVRLAGLGPYDRLLGVMFGAARGVVAVVGLALLAGLTAMPKTTFWQSAQSRVPLELAAQKVVPWLPRDVSVLIKYS
ncbi:MAG: CvpA family protein [Pseudomonadota bacterium]